MTGSRPLEEFKRNLESIIRTVVAFFAALIGFGLKRILDISGHHEYMMQRRWFCFIVATLFFLRFLTGATSHLWFEHVREHANDTRDAVVTAVLIDLATLLGFGLVALRICYARNANEFFGSAVFLSAAALFWGIIGSRVRSKLAYPDRGEWQFFRVINIIHGLGFAFVWFWEVFWNAGAPPGFHRNGPWFVLLIVSALVLYLDVRSQLRVISRNAILNGRGAREGEYASD